MKPLGWNFKYIALGANWWFRMSKITELQARIKRYERALESKGDFASHESMTEIRNKITEMKEELKGLKE